jgi:hypothetical protein
MHLYSHYYTVKYRPIAKQRTSQYASLTIEDVFSACSVKISYKEAFGRVEKNSSSRDEKRQVSGLQPVGIRTWEQRN